ncbi:uncharacterized protein M6B38_102700 [Iris pallida]|uniref:C2 domain-containing protein n=1 Tax=Iris pallida TaxID=29817 RepID=A0AAX6G6G8_IRIPA|nr:uncharacterized protein M6B38_102700 [Iris pallida]
MADGGSRRVVVEVCSAKNLMPKDGQGTASAYAIVDFDGQRRRTKTKPRDLNPQWEEKLEFLVHDPDAMASETLEINVYNDKKAGKRSTFLGKVKISGSSFAKSGSESLVYYPLEKRSVFSQIKGEIGVKICYVDEPPPPPKEDPKPEAPPAEEKKPEAEEAKAEEKPKTEEAKAEEKPKTEEKKAEDKPKEEEKPKPEAEAAAATAVAVPAATTDPPPPPAAPLASPAKDAPNSTDLDIRPHYGERAGSSYDLVERVPYLFVRVLKAKHPGSDAYAKVVIGSHSIKTRTVKGTDWDQVFAFHKASLNSTALEVSVISEEKKKIKKDNATAETKKEGEDAAEKKKEDEEEVEVVVETSLGTVSFDLQELPKRSPPDSPLAPQWYTLEGGSLPDAATGHDVMLAVWIGTQADEAFQEAWQSDSGGLISHTRSKAYLSPKLWYLRLTVIQTQDLRLATVPDPKAAGSAWPELFVKAQLGNQIFKTGRVPLCSSSSSANPTWKEDLVFVAAEPFDPFLTIGVEDGTANQPVGHAKLPLSTIHRRVDNRAEPPSRWLNLSGDEARPYAGRVHVRACLEGGYHVLDEAAHLTSDVRAASKMLSKPPIGLLEVGVRGASNLVPMKVAKDGSSGSTDAYVVLKYGPKWARTRTILDQFNPWWHEQYAWDVFDPCTALTIAVLDNARYKPAPADAGDKPRKDMRIGKVRIRLSTLDTNRVYRNAYPLTAVTPFGAKKMGEIELAIRFSCTSYISLIQSYGSPMLPRMHYVHPLTPAQQDMLRHTAIRIVSTRLGRSEPPLGSEVVHFVLDTDSHVWSMRRSKANWFRVLSCLSRVAGLAKWVHGVRMWAQPATSVLVHVLLVAIVLCPHMILPTVFLYVFLILVWRYRSRPREPSGMDPRLSHVDSVGLDELDEEFDAFPSNRAQEQVRMRYDRLRVLAGRAQTLLGDVASQGERVEALLNWRDPRATGLFVVFCLLASMVFYVVPFKTLLLFSGFYYLRHPKFRDDMPSLSFNFFRRLPSFADRIL